MRDWFVTIPRGVKSVGSHKTHVVRVEGLKYSGPAICGAQVQLYEVRELLVAATMVCATCWKSAKPGEIIPLKDNVTVHVHVPGEEPHAYSV